jgi:hypothetical protein
MIPQNYILDLKKDTMFQQIKEGIINKHISDVLLGKKGYAMSWLPIPSNTEPNIIIKRL